MPIVASGIAADMTDGSVAGGWTTGWLTNAAALNWSLRAGRDTLIC